MSIPKCHLILVCAILCNCFVLFYISHVQSNFGEEINIVKALEGVGKVGSTNRRDGNRIDFESEVTIVILEFEEFENDLPRTREPLLLTCLLQQYISGPAKLNNCHDSLTWQFISHVPLSPRRVQHSLLFCSGDIIPWGLWHWHWDLSTWNWEMWVFGESKGYVHNWIKICWWPWICMGESPWRGIF